MARRVAWAAGVVAVAAALGGCAGALNAQAPAAAPAPTVTAAEGGADRYPGAPEGVVDEDTGEVITARPVPAWDDASRDSALEAAQAAMTAFARPDLDYDAWWVGLEPLLTQQAGLDYAYVDPANVPATAVTGPATLAEETSAYVATVEVPTDVGLYAVVLTRQDADAPWLTARISPAQGDQ
ncbi:hypothetical protein ACFVSK_11395 [Cellulosimicrobium cellulans]|uniref:hypothetical protein n=1 Tax=Cellulosimicrobium cellulans TaxID=1710 RepID=UPI0036E31F6C